MRGSHSPERHPCCLFHRRRLIQTAAPPGLVTANTWKHVHTTGSSQASCVFAKLAAPAETRGIARFTPPYRLPRALYKYTKPTRAHSEPGQGPAMAYTRTHTLVKPAKLRGCCKNGVTPPLRLGVIPCVHCHIWRDHVLDHGLHINSFCCDHAICTHW